MTAPSNTTGTLCVTFDNMGRAKDIWDGLASLPDANHPSLAIGYPRVLGLLDELGLKATFFIEAWNCIHHPERVAELAARGHEVGLHGWIHEVFHLLDARKAEQLISDGKAAMRNIGVDTTLFRAPGGIRGPQTAGILERHAFIGDSSVEHSLEDELRLGAETFPTEPSLLSPKLANIPWHWRMNDVINYRNLAPGPDGPQRLQAAWIAALDRLEQRGGTLTVTIHAYMSGADEQRFSALGNVLREARRRAIRFDTIGSIARRLTSA